MKYHSSSFFCSSDPNKGPKISISPNPPVQNDNWPISVSISTSNSYSHAPYISFHLANELQLIALRNSIVWEYERYMRKVYGK